jgi:hypothetical protein
MSTANVHIVFKTVVRCIGNEGAVNQVKSDSYVFHDHKDTTLEAIHHTLKDDNTSGRRLGKNEDCNCEGGDNVQVTKKLGVVQ